MRLSVQRTHVARGHAQSAVAYRAWRWGAVRASSMMKVITQRPGAGRSPPIPRVRSRPRYSPPPHTAPSWVTWVLASPIDYTPHGSGLDRTATGVRVKTAARPRRCRSDLRSGSPTPYTCDVGTYSWTDTSAVRSLTHTEQRNRCGLAALSTRDSPRSSCVARRGRAPARRTADRLRTSRPRCRTRGRTYRPRDRISGGGTRPSAVLSRPKPGARV